MPSDCVAQREAIYALEKGEIDITSGMIGRTPTIAESHDLGAR
jgi:hypothetical protein